MTNTQKLKLANVRDSVSKGWLICTTIDSRKIELPLGIQVKLINSQNKNCLVKVLEGIYKGILILTTLDYFTPVNSDSSKQKHTLTISKTSKILYFDETRYKKIIISNKLNIGKYYLCIPDYIHKNNIKKYLNEPQGGSRYAETWFRILDDKKSIYQSKEYLHFGTYSKGCITFPYWKNEYPSEWNKIVSFLSNSRISEGICAELNILD